MQAVEVINSIKHDVFNILTQTEHSVISRAEDGKHNDSLQWLSSEEPAHQSI